MGTDVISNLAGSLDAELEKARETLRCVDDDIKKVFGKDASELQMFGRGRRMEPPVKEDHNSFGRPGIRRRDSEYERDGDEPSEKRWRGAGGGAGMGGPGQRFGAGPQGEEAGRRLQSRIVFSGKEKSREEVLAEQRQDRSGRERNKRMFGALLGTLQRFKQDETRLKEKEEKRAQIEAKLDEAAKKEREVVKTKKQELIKERRTKLTEIRRIEVKRRRIQELEEWEEKTKYLANFIRTEAKPSIFYKPKIMNPIMECRMEQSKQYVTELIAHRRKVVLEDLEDYEQRSKRYWEGRSNEKAGRKFDVVDADIEDELDEIMKNEDVDVQLGEGDDFTVTVYNNVDKEDRNGQTENGDEDISIKEEGDAGVVENLTIEVKVDEGPAEQDMNTSEDADPSSEPTNVSRNDEAMDDEPQDE